MQVLEQKMIRPLPQRIVWVYSVWQHAYERIMKVQRKPKVEFHRGFDDELYETLDPTVRNLVVLDDQMENQDMHKGSGSKLARFFTEGSHHLNLTIIYIVQNVFHHAPAMRTVSLNSNYLVLFHNARDKTQIRTLAMQMFPSNPRFLTDAFEDATSTPYGYLVVDIKPDTPSVVRVRTSVFNPSEQVVYLAPDEQQHGGGCIDVPV